MGRIACRRNPIRTGLAKVLADAQLAPDMRAFGDWTWFRDSLIMSARHADSTNLWRIPISPETFHAAGNLRRMTFGAGQDVLPSVSPDGQLVFASLRKSVQIWTVPVEINGGVARGGIEPLTTDAVIKAWPSISENGRYLVFVGYRGGRQEIWLRDLQTQEDRKLTTTPASGVAPAITHDGSEVAFGPPFPRNGERSDSTPFVHGTDLPNPFANNVGILRIGRMTRPKFYTMSARAATLPGSIRNQVKNMCFSATRFTRFGAAASLRTTAGWLLKP